MLDFRIETFLEVCKDMNFTKAAKSLNMTQPAVSQHIKWLEEHYESRLFSTQGKKLILTPAGEMLKNASLTMSHDISFLKDKMKATTEKQQTLKMGLTLTIAEFGVSRSIAAYLNQNPDYSMFLSVGNTEKLLLELEEGKIDFALIEGNFPNALYHHRLYSREAYIAVCSPDDSFAKGSYNLEDLLARRLITRESGSGTRNILERFLFARSLDVSHFSAVVEAGSIDLIKQLVAYNCGITFLYRAAVQAELDRGELCEIQMKDIHIVHDFSFIWREDTIFQETYEDIFNMFIKNKEQQQVEVRR